MRKFIRFLVGLIMPFAVIAAVSWAITLKAYHEASLPMQRGTVIGIAVAGFIIEWILMARVIPPKKKTAQRTPYPYAPAGRGK